MDHNRYEIPAAVAYSRHAGVEEFILKEVGPRYVPRTGDNGNPMETAVKLRNKLNICAKLWTETYIGCNGIVRPCCLTFDGTMGNVLTEDFKSIWNNKKYTMSRQIFAPSGQSAFIQHVPCLNCHLLSSWIDPVKTEEDGA